MPLHHPACSAWWLVRFISICLSLPGSVVVADSPTYFELDSFKAEARFSAAPDTPYISHGQPNKLAAAVNAQHACRQDNKVDSAAGYCELVKSDNQPITTAADILAQVPNGNKPLFLWRYQTRSATVYLAGSLHFFKPGLYPLPAQLQHAFADSDTLVVEVDISALTPQLIRQKTMAYGILPDDQTLPQVLPANIYQKLNVITTQYGLPLTQSARFKPALVSQQLAVSALVAVGYDPSLGLEAFFIQQADNKRLLELETVDQQLDLLLNQPLDMQLYLIEEALQEMENFESITTELIVAWLSGDDKTIAKLVASQSGTRSGASSGISGEASLAFMYQLMDVRNIAMAEKIATLLRSTGSYFILVGVGHFVGDNSLIKLLQQQGFNGQRIFSQQDIRQR